MENSGEEVNKLEEKEAVDYSLVLSEIYYRVSNSENEFPESAYDDLVREVEGILSENRFTNGISGVKYSVAQHYYLYSKYNSVFKILQSGSKAAFNYGVFARDFYPKSAEQKIMIDAEKKDLLSELENLRAKPKEKHYTSQETTIRNIEKMVETFNFKYEIYNISESHYKVKYEPSNFEQVKRFSLFFNWYLASLSSFEIVHFLLFHLKDSFENNIKEFTNFLRLTIANDRYGIVPKTTRDVAFEEVETLDSINTPVDSVRIDSVENKEKKRGGRPKKESFTIPVPQFTRKSKDGKTRLTRHQTALCFSLLAKMGIILAPKEVYEEGNDISKDAFCQTINILTGYSEKTIRDLLRANLDKKSGSIRQSLADFNELIISTLK